LGVLQNHARCINEDTGETRITIGLGNVQIISANITGCRAALAAFEAAGVDVQVAGLRKKLGAFGSYIETVRGVGYRFRG
jgi:hypothetical protein